MIVKIKFCVDSKSNVGIFHVEVKQGSSHVAFEEVTAKGTYHLSFVNEAGKIHTRIINPDRLQTNEPLKTRQKTHANDVYRLSDAIVMVLALEEINDANPAEKELQLEEEPSTSEAQAPGMDVFPSVPVALAKAKLPETFSTQEAREDTFKRKLHLDTDTSQLPPVRNSRLNHNYIYSPMMGKVQFPIANKKVDEKPSTPETPVAAPETPVAKPTALSEITVFKPTKEFFGTRTKSQLLESDVRDQRFFLKGHKFTLQNKMGAAFILLALMMISAYSFILQRETQSVSLQQNLLAQEEFLENVATQWENQFTQLQNSVETTAQAMAALQKTIPDGRWGAYSALDPLMQANPWIAHMSAYRWEELPERPTQKQKSHSKNVKEEPLVLEKYDLAVSETHMLRLVYQHSKDEAMKKYGQQVPEGIMAHQKISFGQLVQARNVATSNNLGDVNPQKTFLITKVVESDSKKLFLTFDVDLRALWQLPTSSRYRLAILNAGGQPLGLQNWNLDSQVVQDVAGLTAGQFSSVTSPDQKRHLAYKKSSTGLVFYSDFSLNHQESSGVKPHILIFALITFVLMAILGQWFSYIFTRRLYKLTASLESVAAGNSAQLHRTRAGDEIGVVSDYIRHLANTLDSKNEELAQITDQAFKDPLTGLHTHRYLQRKVEDVLKAGQTFSLLLLDVDHFKKFNSTHGHSQGDQVLIKLAKILKEFCKEKHLAIRYGGEEFALFMPQVDAMQALQMLDQIMVKIRSCQIPNLTGGATYTVSCSVGVVSGSSEKFPTVSDVLQTAESHLRQAKKLGRNRGFAT
ncbi:MAG: GGDEF domain-containing protein [Bdellovibrionales bacterium]